MIEKARGIDADLVMLDLEDAVAVEEKDRARSNVIEALQSGSWRTPCLSVRINALDTPWCYRDIVEITETVGSAVATFTVPKVASAADVHFVVTLLDQVERFVELEDQIGLSVLIETAAGMTNANAIAAACPDRMEAIVFGVGDYAASLQSPTMAIGGFDSSYAVLADSPDNDQHNLHYGDQWHFALSQIAIACRANGLRPIDGPFGDLSNPAGYLASARRAASLGYEGKWAIHPSQVGLANRVFTPDPQKVEHSRRIVAAMEAAAEGGTGATTLDGALVDAASVRMARSVLEKFERIRKDRNGHRSGIATDVDPAGHAQLASNAATKRADERGTHRPRH